MTDEQLLEALTTLARRAGLIGPGQRVAIVADEVPPIARCGRPSEPERHGVTLLCSRDEGHYAIAGTPCSWETAFVGAVAPSMADAELRVAYSAAKADERARGVRP